jgi:mono/diheme cytochrome c family protein
MSRCAARILSIAWLGALVGSATIGHAQDDLWNANLTGHAGTGKQLYRRYCTGCHGDDGDGVGENAQWIDPKPRDFTLAVFKCRSTPSGTLPTDADLLRSIRRGLVNSNMPPWRPLTNQMAVDLLAYIKTFSPRWQAEKPGTPITIPPEIPLTTDGLLQGRATFQKLECWKCHGPTGKADGPSASSLTDSKDNPIKPFNFHDGDRFKCGTTNTDLYRIFMTGLDGTPMASFADDLKGDEAWNLVHYLRTLQPINTPESALWKEYLAAHPGQLKPIGPAGAGQ